jgi:hypothetical protein
MHDNIYTVKDMGETYHFRVIRHIQLHTFLGQIWNGRLEELKTNEEMLTPLSHRCNKHAIKKFIPQFGDVPRSNPPFGHWPYSRTGANL